jgi:hypothetical protein
MRVHAIALALTMTLSTAAHATQKNQALPDRTARSAAPSYGSVWKPLFPLARGAARLVGKRLMPTTERAGIRTGGFTFIDFVVNPARAK